MRFTTDRFHHPKGLSEYQLSILKCSHILKPKKLNRFGLILVILDKLKKPGELFVTLPGLRLYRESHSDPLTENIPRKSLFFTGYFINKFNVEQVRNTLSHEFCGTLSAIFENKWRSLLPKEYEAIHVRKGDFKFYQDSYGILSDEYYISGVQKKLPLILVTDLREESEDLITLLKPDHIFDSSNSSAWDALAIMSHAEVLHISNSTLSWWGGFGAIENGKKVFLPSPFYKSMSTSESNEIFKLEEFQAAPSNFI